MENKLRRISLNSFRGSSAIEGLAPDAQVFDIEERWARGEIDDVEFYSLMFYQIYLQTGKIIDPVHDIIDVIDSFAAFFSEETVKRKRAEAEQLGIEVRKRLQTLIKGQ